MVRKWLTALVAIVAVVSLGGIGFAAFTSTITLNLNGAAGTLNIEWTGPASPAVTTSAPYVTCAVSLTASTVTLKVGNLAPGDSCTIPASDGIEVMNTGTIPASMYMQGQITGGSCGWFQGYNFGPPSLPISPSPPAFFGTLAPGASAPAGGYATTFGFDSGQPGCQGATLQVVEYLNATAGS